MNLVDAVRKAELVGRLGRASSLSGLVLEASGPNSFLGELCEILCPGRARPVMAEVVGFRDGKVLLMPYGDLHGIQVGSEIIATGRTARVPVGEHLAGRVINAFGEPLDGRPLPAATAFYPLHPEPLNPMRRERIRDVIDTGVRAIDLFLTTGKGQRVGIMAGSGVGKSSLLGMLARNATSDVNVIALIGERGREVMDFLEDCLGEEGLARSVVVVATADEHALVRSYAAYSATAIAEYFRDQGRDVLLFMDSVTRFAMARREIGLAIGEPPTSRGYPPSVFAGIPRLVERAGNVAGVGSITAVYSVLVEGDDMNEPVADALRAVLDGHFVLSRKLAHAGQYPALDILQSVSRLQKDLVDDDFMQKVRRAVELQALYTESRDLIDVGAYVEKANPELDSAILFARELRSILSQHVLENADKVQARSALEAALANASRTSRPGNRL